MNMNNVLPVAVLLMAVAAIAGCTSSVQTGASIGLNIENSFLAQKDAEGTLTPVSNNTFIRGQSVNYVFINVGEFKKGPDGKNWFDIDLDVTNSTGEKVLSQQGLLGENGKVALDNNIAASPYAEFLTTTDIATGTYTITMTITDKISGATASKSTPFILT